MDSKDIERIVIEYYEKPKINITDNLYKMG